MANKNGGWTPLQKATWTRHPKAEEVRRMAANYGCTEQELRDALDRDESDCETWVNDLYQVQLRRAYDGHGDRLIWLNIRRRDGKPIFRDWRHFQRIKNELCGEECEAVELYPAESRLNDTSNKYHLFAYPDGRRFPFGMDYRDVNDDMGHKAPGYRQRKL